MFNLQTLSSQFSAVSETTRTLLSFIIIFIVSLPFVKTSASQTVVSGSVSGTWPASSCPYFVSADLLIPQGQSLTIEAPCEVIIGDSLTIRVKGQLLAVGDSANHILFHSPNDTLHFNSITIEGPPTDVGNPVTDEAFISKFNFVQIRNARTGILFTLHNIRTQYTTQITNTRFENIKDQAIYGSSSAGLFCTPICYPQEPRLDPFIHSNIFDQTGRGIVMTVSGRSGTGGPARGHSSARISNNLFKNLSGSAIEFRSGNYGGSSQPLVTNNTVVHSFQGIYTEDPFDGVFENNIFYANTIGVQRTGGLSLVLNFNNFFDSDSAHIIGYPSSYGEIVHENRNGYDADIAFNIFEDPVFVDEHAFDLSAVSPMIDSGNADSLYNDVCFPPSQGSEINDIGFTGGTEACGLPLEKASATNNREEDTYNDFSLDQNYPNPFSRISYIPFELKSPSHVTLVVYDALGREVLRPVDQALSLGLHNIPFDGAKITSGVYYYRLQAGNSVMTRQMIIIRTN